jgi:serine carboxypeptidase-like clade 2
LLILIIILFYSGDVDGRVPFIGSRYWVDAIGLPIKSQWQPWYLKNQVGQATTSPKFLYLFI